MAQKSFLAFFETNKNVQKMRKMIFGFLHSTSISCDSRLSKFEFMSKKLIEQITQFISNDKNIKLKKLQTNLNVAAIMGICRWVGLQQFLHMV